MKTIKLLFVVSAIIVWAMQPLASQTKKITNNACAGVKAICVIKNNIVFTGDYLVIDFYFTTTDASMQYSIALPYEETKIADSTDEEQNISVLDKSMGAIETINSKKYLVISSINKDKIFFKNLEGKCSFKLTCEGMGERILEGYLISNNKERCMLPFKQEYFVQTPTSVVAADKMNVFYAGLQNPISIAIPGIADELVQATCTGGTLTKTEKGKWNVTVAPGTKEMTIQVSANIDGVNRSFRQTKFRVKPFPSPTYIIIGVPYGKTEIKKSTLCEIGEVKAIYVDFIFDGVSFKVTEFTVSGENPYFEVKCKGSKFSEDAKTLIKQSAIGSKITIDRVKGIAADGSSRTLCDSITLTLIE